eukprot:TRINITY_DN67149_c1_g6_i1.p1 TRINITY_DN67149_c1_g6~~TRINITY_DN67149_c1_g6_i1.p1  ORF type:complete len:377 (+),score=-8.99 TRINITY_DN67149_c1_g6_i1:69-1133(+)
MQLAQTPASTPSRPSRFNMISDLVANFHQQNYIDATDGTTSPVLQYLIKLQLQEETYITLMETHARRRLAMEFEVWREATQQSTTMRTLLPKGIANGSSSVHRRIQSAAARQELPPLRPSSSRYRAVGSHVGSPVSAARFSGGGRSTPPLSPFSKRKGSASSTGSSRGSSADRNGQHLANVSRKPRAASGGIYRPFSVSALQAIETVQRHELYWQWRDIWAAIADQCNADAVSLLSPSSSVGRAVTAPLGATPPRVYTKYSTIGAVQPVTRTQTAFSPSSTRISSPVQDIHIRRKAGESLAMACWEAFSPISRPQTQNKPRKDILPGPPPAATTLNPILPQSNTSHGSPSLPPG